MKKVVIVITLFILVFMSTNSIYAKDKSIINELGVSFKKSELVHMKKLGLSDFEISVLTVQEKAKYIDKKIDSLEQIEIYERLYYEEEVIGGNKTKKLKTEKISKEEAVLIKAKKDKKIKKSDDNLTALTMSPSSLIELEGGGGINDTWGNTYYTDDDSDEAVRLFRISAAYNYTDDTMFVKTSVQWYQMPYDRGWDLINISHDIGYWYCDYYLKYNSSIDAYEEIHMFDGKQIYDWTEYDSRNSNPYGATTRITIPYDETLSTDYFKKDISKGIVLKQNLKNNELECHNCGSHYNYNQYVDGYVVTDLLLTLEADFLNNDNRSSGVFYGGSMHQESYTTIDIDDISFTYIPPFISVPLGWLQWGRKYEDVGLGASVHVPIS